jgi:enamine deaminase RidA (YjgF/YER057c/UK114 family)
MVGSTQREKDGDHGGQNRTVSARGDEYKDVRGAAFLFACRDRKRHRKDRLYCRAVGPDIDGNCIGKGDMRAQMEQTFQNLDRCLKAAGATWADVVKTNTFVTDFDEFQKCGDVRMRYFGVATPTSTTVGVTRLAGPDFMIEIEAVAVVDA